MNLQEPIVVIPMARWDRITEKAMRFGLLLSKEIKVVHVHSDDDNDEGLAGFGTRRCWRRSGRRD